MGWFCLFHKSTEVFTVTSDKTKLGSKVNHYRKKKKKPGLLGRLKQLTIMKVLGKPQSSRNMECQLHRGRDSHPFCALTIPMA